MIFTPFKSPAEVMTELDSGGRQTGGMDGAIGRQVVFKE
jgi:hypothetical protein